MFLFLLTFLLLYASINSYLLWKVHRAFPRMGWWLLVPAGILVLMVIGPVLVQLLARWGHALIARGLAMLAYPWMALILWFIALGGLLELWNLAAGGAASFSPGAGRLVLGPRAQLVALGCGVALLGVWGAWEARCVRPKQLTVRASLLPPGSTPIRIAVIADLHMSGLVSGGRLERAARIIEDARPDVLVSLGDLIDAPLPDDSGIAARLAAIRVPLGKFAIFGNHEFYAGPERSTRLLEACGFRVLRGEAVTAGSVQLVGVDDPAGRAFGSAARTDELAILPTGSGRPFTVLLKHRPDVSEAAVGRFDLQLSGHTHGGQVFPFHLLVKLMFPKIGGLYGLEGGARLYVSRGTGTWGPPMRLLSRPEVTVILLEPADAAAPASSRGG